MKTLLHVCCGPCALYPLQQLEKLGHQITGYFYNPNIHPFKEFKRRQVSLEEYAKSINLKLHVEREYGLTSFMREVVFKEDKRCPICYEMRLLKCVQFAKNNNYEAFTTTLLYSRYQNHGTIIEICNKLEEQYDIKFIYNDYRIGWQKGIDESIALNLYRQPYCGCIYSEQERYDKKFKKKNKKN